MKVAQAILWLVFLILGGREIRSWQEAGLAANSETASHNSLERIASASLSQPRQVPIAQKAIAVPQSSRSSPSIRQWPNQTRHTLPDGFEVQTLESNQDSSRWSYRSEHFDFVSDAALPDEAVEEFASLFELTHLYCSRLPFELQRFQKGKNHRAGRLKVRLMEDYSNYLREGGTPESGGIYLTEPDLILIPFEGIGLRKEDGTYQLDSTRTNQTLMHEATHMMMRGPLLKDGWFVEGAAEYVATIPKKTNTLHVDSHLDAIKSYVCDYGYQDRGGHNLGPEIEFVSLQTLMECDYPTFQEIPNGYPYALLLFHYFAHADGEADGQRLRDYAKALNQGAENGTARKILLAGRDYRTLEKLLTNSWEKDGISLTFRN
ncbi:hypothetical protein [Roseibacillus persicicus]|uniref:hypothetical protein n=1 Tax=Roseibacillus persicicus TaxID=454148 RepID=UPI00167A7C7A|nr:hypothetical protein [Roseibacillus persicicus]